jgi:cytochrome P450
MSDTTEHSIRMVDADPYTIPLDQIDVSQPELYEQNRQWAFFERLRKDDPVHYCASSPYGAYWSITRFNDITQVEKNHQVYSSEPTITINDVPEDIPFQAFIMMDPPKHDHQRAAVQPVAEPANVARLAPIIRERAGRILDSLPAGETFDWVDRVSVELTSQMLATLFDFPFEDRRKLTYWSDVTGDITGGADGNFVSAQERSEAMADCMASFTRLWHERVNRPGGNDLISMLIQSEATRDLVSNPIEYLGNVLMLIVGGNDTTRNSITGGVYALNKYPQEYQKLRENHSLIPNMVSEIIRWQTPVASQRRNAKQDTELCGKQIRKGDKVILWYASGNRDADVIEDPDRLIIDRERARHHLSFGFGIHRCMGNRLAEMQLRIVWEEIMKRFEWVEVVGEPTRLKSNMIHGYTAMPVRLHPLKQPENPR